MRGVRKVLLLVVSVVSLGVMIGCGGGSQHFDPNSVTVTIAPASANVPTAGTLTLQATVHGDCSGCPPVMDFQIQELKTNGASGAQCNWITGDPEPPGPCPYGTLEVPLGGGSQVTFHAPSTTGTVHVIAEDLVPQAGSFNVISKTATATVTVQ